MNSRDVMGRAKQGEPAAIAHLINQALASKGIVAKVTRSGDRLKIMLEGEQVPEQATLVPYLQGSMTKLGIPSIRLLQLYGRQTCAAIPAWTQTVELATFRAYEAAASGPVEPLVSPERSPIPPAAKNPVASVPPAASRHTQTVQVQQLIFGGLAALVFILIGANLRSIMTLVTRQTAFVSAPASVDGAYQVPIVESLNGIPVINVTFNGSHTFPMMVDTGASGTLITRPMATALAVRPIGQVTSATANGVAVFEVGYISSIQIDGAKVVNVPVAIGLRDLEIGLLGHDFFQFFDVTIRQEVVEFRPRR